MTIDRLPLDVQRSATVLENGEVEWPADAARAAVDALAAAGATVLGLDLRDYDAEGRFTEVAWTSFEPIGDGTDVEQARLAAQSALDRPEVAALGLASARVLITWDRT